MANKKKSSGSAKRFGVRYGRTTREKVGKIEKLVRSRQKCPYCSKNNVKRIALGIWNCRTCDAKFSGGAYTLKKEVKTEVTK